MSKRKIVSFLLLLLLTVSVFIANIIIIENAKGQLPDVGLMKVRDAETGHEQWMYSGKILC